MFFFSTTFLGGVVAAAAKVAGNELHGLISYFSTNVPGLSFPLMCLLDYKGFRLVCSSLLPINKTTLVYGSQNAGKNFVNSDQEVYESVTEASRILNLKGHFVGDTNQPIHSPCDLEGFLFFFAGIFVFLFLSKRKRKVIVELMEESTCWISLAICLLFELERMLCPGDLRICICIVCSVQSLLHLTRSRFVQMPFLDSWTLMLQILRRTMKKSRFVMAIL